MVTTGTPTIVKAILSGNSGQGSVSVPGLLIGDVVLKFLPFSFENGFEPVVTVDDQFQQSRDLDWSGVELTVYFLRGV